MANPSELDLTAVLVPLDAHDEASLRRAVDEAGYGDVWVRVARLDKVGMWQLEVFDAGGLPRIDPSLVMRLATDGKPALFVHLNRQAGQAVVHAFKGGEQLEGWIGEPAELDGHLAPHAGHNVDEIIAADDGTRPGIGVVASGTQAVARGRHLAVPVGAPMMLGSLGFHDVGHDAAGEEDRVALLAVDAAAVERAWSSETGEALAARIEALPASVAGPLKGTRDEAVETLRQLGARTPAAAGLESALALEHLALAESYVFAGGEAVSFVEQRFLPVFSLASSDPVFDDEDDLDELASVLAVMVEVLPFAQPEGRLVSGIADAEVRPLAPWAQSGGEYVGSLFLVDNERLGKLLGGELRDLAGRVELFYRAWWKSENDGPLDEKFMEWRREWDRKGDADVQRVLRDWAEWRTTLALARANKLSTALLFYGA